MAMKRRAVEDLQEVRRQAGLPPDLQMIQFLNPGRTMCYSNAGTNTLFSTPEVSSFLARLPPSQGLLSIMGGLARTFPDEVSNSLLSNCIDPHVPRCPRAPPLYALT